MNPIVRKFRADDTPRLIALFRNTIQQVNRRDYTAEQIAAWAREDIDAEAWAEEFSTRITLVIEECRTSRILGFTDLESNGHIDRFFVHHERQREGLGSLLLNAIELEAGAIGLDKLFLEASITAKPFFARKGFMLVNENTVVRRGVEFLNYSMEKRLR